MPTFYKPGGPDLNISEQQAIQFQGGSQADPYAGLYKSGYQMRGETPTPSAPTVFETADKNKGTLTVPSSALVNAPLQFDQTNLNYNQSNIPTFDQAMQTVKNQFSPLSDAQRQSILGGVEAQFAPKFQRQQIIGENQQNLFAGLAARRAQGITGARSEAQGQTQIAQEQERNIRQLEDLMNAEKQARLQAAESQNFEQQVNYINLADQLQQRAQQKFKDYFTMNIQQQQLQEQMKTSQAARAQSQFDLLSKLDSSGLQQLGLDQSAISNLESQLGVPTGFVSRYQETQKRANEAATTQEQDKIFNDIQQIALDIPEGLTLPYRIGGEEFQITGMKNDYQIVSDKGGIFRVNKTTGEITQLRGPSSGGTSSGSGVSGTSGSSGASGIKTFGDLLAQAQRLGAQNQTGLLGATAGEAPALQQRLLNQATGLQSPSKEAQLILSDVSMQNQDALRNYLQGNKEGTVTDDAVNTLIDNYLAQQGL